MAEEKTGEEGKVELTQEQLDAQNAEKYRTQLNGGEPTGQVVDEGNKGGEKPQRPEHIPEKFWDAEKGEVNVDAMAKSYAELEKSKAKPAEKSEAEMTDEEKAAKAEADKAAAEAATAFAEHRQKMTDKMLAGEAFADEDYAPFEKLGLSRDDVDTFAAGLQAIGELHKAKVHSEAGGEDAYKDMLAWAKDNFSAEEVAAYNRDVHSGDSAVSLNAVRGLAARYKLANGRGGRDVTNKGGTKTTEGYQSKAEMVADMAKPEYRTNPAFREEVMRKVGAARRAGVDLTA